MSIALLALAAPTSANQDLPTGTEVDGECVWLYHFPDAGMAYCVDKDESDDCLVYTITVGITGSTTTCRVHDP